MSRFTRSPFDFSFAFAIMAAALTGATLTVCTKTKEAAPTREVHLAIWGNYISPQAQEQFTKETGVQLKISNYTSNEELLAKVQAGSSGLDVAVPSDYMVAVMIKLGLLSPLDAKLIPSKAGLDAKFLRQSYDPENQFSLPYSWTTAGIAINRDLFKGEIKGWKDLFGNKDLGGKLSMLDDVREVTAAALKLNGFSVNSTDEVQLKKAKESLTQLKPRIKMFRSDIMDPLVNKEVAVAHAYSSDAMQAARKSGGKIVYIIPEEGGTRAIDNLVILKSAKNIEAAHALINFLLKPAVNIEFVKAVMGGPVVVATKAGLPLELQNNPALFPPPERMEKLEAIHDVGEATKLYDRLWTEIKSE